MYSQYWTMGVQYSVYVVVKQAIRRHLTVGTFIGNIYETSQSDVYSFCQQYTYICIPLVYIVILVTVSGLILILSFLSLSSEEANFLHGLTRFNLSYFCYFFIKP